MNPEQLELLLQASSPEALAAMIEQYRLSIDTIQAMKDDLEQLYISDPTQALQIAQLAHQLSLHMPAPAPTLGRLTLANVLLYADRYHEAAPLYEQIYKEHVRHGRLLDAARVSVGYIFVLAYIGEPERALLLAKESEAMLAASSQTEAADRVRLGNLFMNVGVVHELLGQYEEALSIYDRLWLLATQLSDQLLLGQVAHNRAYALAQIGALPEAISAYAQAEAFFVALDAKVELVRLNMNLALALDRLNLYTEAQKVYQKAADLLATMSGMTQQQHELTLVRALVDLKNGVQLAEAALPALFAAQQTFVAHGNSIGAGLTLIVLGLYYSKKGAWANAFGAFVQARQLAVQNMDRLLEYRALYGLGQLAETQQQIPEAIQYYTAAIHRIESIRQALRIETFRADFLTDKLIAYQDLAHIYLQLGQLDAAFQMIERAKSRVLMEKLAFRLGVEAVRLAAVAEAPVRLLTSALNEQLNQLEVLYRQARQASFQQDANLDAAKVTNIQLEIVQLEQQVQTLTRTIQRQQPFFSPFATAEPAPLAQIQAQLHDETLLYYYILHKEIWAFVINAAGIQVNLRLGTLTALETARQAFLTAVERTLAIVVQTGPVRATRFLPGLLADVNKHLHTLYAQLLQPVVAHLPTGQPLLIAPDGPLHTLPFHALYDQQSYFVEQYAISLIPSASILEFCRQPSLSSTARVLLLGYDDERLGSVTPEIQMLTHLFPFADLLFGQAATTQNFLNKAEDYAILHLATHAQFRADDPLLSSLALADRRLTLAEIARLQLNADMVVLNGCETGHGQLRGGDLLSLAGGFLGAGARSLLVSLWRVEDRVAAIVMAHFYRALLAGLSRAAALRAAQLALLNDGRHATGEERLYLHPAFWAPFTLIGNSLELPQFRQT